MLEPLPWRSYPGRDTCTMASCWGLKAGTAEAKMEKNKDMVEDEASAIPLLHGLKNVIADACHTDIHRGASSSKLPEPITYLVVSHRNHDKDEELLLQQHHSIFPLFFSSLPFSSPPSFARRLTTPNGTAPSESHPAHRLHAQKKKKMIKTVGKTGLEQRRGQVGFSSAIPNYRPENPCHKMPPLLPSSPPPLGKVGMRACMHFRVQASPSRRKRVCPGAGLSSSPEFRYYPSQGTKEDPIGTPFCSFRLHHHLSLQTWSYIVMCVLSVSGSRIWGEPRPLL
ncbi:hypothetical protein V8C26DRAFT_249775 [Trichoderma gracile]